jgi:hypothetical protein
LSACSRVLEFVLDTTDIVRDGDVSPATTKEVELTGRATTSTLRS